MGTHLDGEIVASLQSRQLHPGLGLELPGAIRALPARELEAAMSGEEILALGVNSHGVRWAAGKIAPFVKPGLLILMVSKGLEWDGRTLRLL